MSAKPSPIYADNAATSFPKPREVIDTVSSVLGSMSLSPGRSAHQYSLECSRVIFNTREALADFFNCPDSSRIAFTCNVTEALNVGIFGLLGKKLHPGDHVITTALEHNSVMRPLRYLEKTAGINISILPVSGDGEVMVSELPRLMRHNTRLIVANHVSNVTGAVADIEAIGRNKGDAVFMVDAAQSAGVFPIDVVSMNIDMLAFTGHKSLLGPTGSGGFYLRQGLSLRPLKMGGTGSNSETEIQPDFMPDCYEAGTPNTLGIAGLGAGVGFVNRTGIAAIREHEQRLCRLFLEGVGQMKEIRVFGPTADRERAAVISLRVKGKSESEVAQRLDRDFRIMVRAGLHCAPGAHRAMGTFAEGTVRFSLGFFNTEADVTASLTALEIISKN
ncbi:MAG: aminotransferase class V-fold PLP-dependent enzyme [Proteobacteria bacterium]|nr:aminotransferase class V-fold PLP-dependent enzyme [Pseudomonadota bacterium]MBU4294761.1 aminotransferase class V-fold PLP-dependent enzyme [Pseudomonadota bacterium]MCG2749807.1 aminotransferase class V-fold PLP-dependent enzyme [Desulfobulbaceae bacterium]